jgi:branched-chain amino acid transport system ATP-binding protein
MTIALEVSHLVKRFGGLIATNDLSFTLNEGESLGLIGPNGAGKTTVFSQIMGELRQTSGTI